MAKTITLNIDGRDVLFSEAQILEALRVDPATNNSIQRTPDGILVAMEAFFTEEDAICASEIACAVADAWATLLNLVGGWDSKALRAVVPGLCAALDRLESATADSPLRKVRRTPGKNPPSPA